MAGLTARLDHPCLGWLTAARLHRSLPPTTKFWETLGPSGPPVTLELGSNADPQHLKPLSPVTCVLSAARLRRLHPLTKHRVFSGPGFSRSVDLGDTASGGQIVISQEAWLQLRHAMPAAGFPVLRQLGQYQLQSAPAPAWVYEVRCPALPS